MAVGLRGLGLVNVRVLPNFRKFDEGRQKLYAPTTIPLKLVFYSRVVEEKGIELAIESVQQLNRDRDWKVKVVLDIYGPVAASYNERFFQILGLAQNATYKGVLNPDHAPDTLQRYDLMIFPTFYEGEGFPGALVDASIAGLPVIASDWKYNREVLVDGLTGVLCKPHAVEDIVRALQQFIANPASIATMRRHCLERASLYNVDLAVRTILSLGIPTGNVDGSVLSANR
jgi:glycosyltransferase involved in cell wall biosynthesis